MLYNLEIGDLIPQLSPWQKIREFQKRSVELFTNKKNLFMKGIIIKYFNTMQISNMTDEIEDDTIYKDMD